MKTPLRKKGIKRLARRSYPSLATMMVASPDTLKSTVFQVSKKIREEMKQLSSDSHDSILKDTVEAVKQFHWDTVLLEYHKMVPTLMMLLQNLVPKPANKKPFICFLVSLLLKCRHQRMGLVQRAVSIMLYGNGSSKQVSLANSKTMLYMTIPTSSCV